MRILELKPAWIVRDGRHCAFVFLCPHCVKAKAERPTLLTCSVVPWGLIFPKIEEERSFLDAWLPANGFAGYAHGDVVTCRRDFAWTKRGTWETLTISPSIDASKSGHWHGHIANGAIVEGEAPAQPAPKPQKANGIRCYFLEQVEPVRTIRWLRRYARSNAPCRGGKRTWHEARFMLGAFDCEVDLDRDTPPATDPRWPTHCDCGYYAFEADDSRQLDYEHLMRRADTGDVLMLRDAGPGAMWFAPWYSDDPTYRGPDGKTLVVRLPPDNHDWIIDSRASNCTLPKDNVHKCWIRHGAPPDVTVDKRGATCAAGAGSILTKKWHGFLRNGYLVP